MVYFLTLFAGIYMNNLGAENRVKCALEASGVCVYNACLFVDVQHFHAAPKTHRTELVIVNDTVPLAVYNCLHDGKGDM